VEEGDISFVGRLMDVVDDFIVEYESARGSLESPLHRALVVSYALGVIHCDLDLLLQELGASGVLAGKDPRDLFRECAQPALRRQEAYSVEVRSQLVERGWVPHPQESGG